MRKKKDPAKPPGQTKVKFVSATWPSTRGMLIPLTMSPLGDRVCSLTTFQSLQFCVVDDPLLPEIVVEWEVGSAGGQRFPSKMMLCNMSHAPVPRSVSVFEPKAIKSSAKRTTDSTRRRSSEEVGLGMHLPLLLVV